MLLSLILPTYNVEAYLGKCIESCLNQDLPKSEYEIIVVIDGSPDHSINIAKRYQENNDNIKIITRENGGLSAARNTGLKAANGEYVWFVDSDDSITENCLKAIYEEMTQYNLDALWLKWCNMNFAWSFVFKRNFLIDNGFLFKEGLFYEDTEFAYRVLPAAKRIKLFCKVCYTYNIRQGSIAQTISSKKIDDLLSIVEKAKDMDEKYPDVICFRRSASNILITALNQSLAIGYKKGIKNTKRLLKSFLYRKLFLVGSVPNKLMIKSYNISGFYSLISLALLFSQFRKIRNLYKNIIKCK